MDEVSENDDIVNGEIESGKRRTKCRIGFNRLNHGQNASGLTNRIEFYKLNDKGSLLFQLYTPIKDLLWSIPLSEERHERTLSNGYWCGKFIPC